LSKFVSSVALLRWAREHGRTLPVHSVRAPAQPDCCLIFHFVQVNPIRFARSAEKRRCVPVAVHVLGHRKSSINRTYGHLLNLQSTAHGVGIDGVQSTPSLQNFGRCTADGKPSLPAPSADSLIGAHEKTVPRDAIVQLLGIGQGPESNFFNSKYEGIIKIHASVRVYIYNRAASDGKADTGTILVLQ